ncbi:hypothetical protein CEW89_07375 [Celeribacter ethanolicus]|uniref:ABM domain-containing protein n=1 Tax=Celeribacter ethanolicus TaxID=1758178 RepID=A0A291GA35_9RHOB|nr:hypothetical protein [Celeribacter ethanolicus]ATG47403.1 hypothetical protein CEW89_07375 [Celeribacter ethanolicus]
MTDIQILETVTFRLKDGVTETEFMAVACELDDYLNRCPGLCARTLYRDETGLWREDYIWANKAAAKAADAGFMAAPEAQAFMALVARDSVQMAHAPVSLFRSTAAVTV